MPCYKCANGKWKYGQRGRCQFDTLQKCREAEAAILADKHETNPMSRTENTNQWRFDAAKGNASSDVMIHKEFVGEVSDEGDRKVKLVISTGSEDRERDIIDQKGWKLDAYKQNPVVLFGHHYGILPVGRAVSIEAEDDKLIAVAEFVTPDMNPMGDQVLRMLRAGFLNAASVGFRPLKYAFNEERKAFDYSEVELLEFSIVPVPANSEALVAAGLVMDGGADLRTFAKSLLDATEMLCKGVVPPNVSERKADEDDPWEKPDLGSFTDERWDELEDGKKRTIAGHYAWADANPPDSFSGLKLPHHRAGDGYVVWRGVAAAAARLDQTALPSDNLAKVKAHLAAHYRQFDREAPWVANASAWADYVASRDRAALGGDLNDKRLAVLLGTHGFHKEAHVLEQERIVDDTDDGMVKAIETLSETTATQATTIADLEQRLKAGRVLSKRNEDKLADASGLITEVLASVQSQVAEGKHEAKDLDNEQLDDFLDLVRKYLNGIKEATLAAIEHVDATHPDDDKYRAELNAIKDDVLKGIDNVDEFQNSFGYSEETSVTPAKDHVDDAQLNDYLDSLRKISNEIKERVLGAIVHVDDTHPDDDVSRKELNRIKDHVMELIKTVDSFQNTWEWSDDEGDAGEEANEAEANEDVGATEEVKAAPSGDDWVIEIDQAALESHDTVEVDEAALAATIRQEVSATVAGLVSDATTAAVNAARGRIE